MLERSKRRVILDTSVYVAALIAEKGPSAEVLELLIEKEVFNFNTAEILEEVKDVIGREKFAIPKEKQQHLIHLIQEVAFEILQLEQFKVKQCRDPKDDKFLSLAKQVEADYLITWDEDLLVIGRIGNTKVVTPGEFLAILSRTTGQRPVA